MLQHRVKAFLEIGQTRLCVTNHSPLCTSLSLPVSPSVLAAAQSYKDWFTVNIVVIAFVYLLLGRWDYMMSQTDKTSKPEGFTGLVPRKETKDFVVLPKTAAVDIPAR